MFIPCMKCEVFSVSRSREVAKPALLVRCTSQVARAARYFVEDMTFCAPRRVVICVASLQEQLGLTTKDADFSAVWLTRDEFGMTFLDQVGLMDVSDLLELS